jgi:uncharacterized protein YodC (DUF2158 family)
MKLESGNGGMSMGGMQMGMMSMGGMQMSMMSMGGMQMGMMSMGGTSMMGGTTTPAVQHGYHGVSYPTYNSPVQEEYYEDEYVEYDDGDYAEDGNVDYGEYVEDEYVEPTTMNSPVENEHVEPTAKDNWLSFLSAAMKERRWPSGPTAMTARQAYHVGIGDTVQLIGGGPQMTVTSTPNIDLMKWNRTRDRYEQIDLLDGFEITCRWYDNDNNVKSESFNYESLTLIVDGEYVGDDTMDDEECARWLKKKLMEVDEERLLKMISSDEMTQCLNVMKLAEYHGVKYGFSDGGFIHLHGERCAGAIKVMDAFDKIPIEIRLKFITFVEKLLLRLRT